MSRRRYGRSRAQKAGMPTDVEMLAGTLADTASKSIGDNELYWMLYNKHPWIRACVDIISNAVAQEGYDIHPIDDSDEADKDDPRFKQIHEFFRVGFIGKCNTFRKAVKALTADERTYGAGYLRKKYGQVDGERTLVGLERLNARYIIPHLNQDATEIEYYVQLPTKANMQSAVQQAAQQIAGSSMSGTKIPADQIIVFTDAGGDDVLPAPSPLEALDLTAAMDMNVRRHRNSFFENGAAVGNVLVCKDATPDQIINAEKKLRMHHVGSRKAYKNIAIGGDWDVKSLMQSGKNEVDFVKGTGIVVEEVMAVYKVPPGKLRDVAGSMGQAGKGEDDETFEEECVLPIEELLYELFTNEVLNKEFGVTDLRIVPARRNKLKLERFAAAVNGSKIGMTGNELRDLVGLPQSDHDGMDVPLFLGATAGNVAQDEAGAQPQGPQEGNVTTPNEAKNATGADKEVGKNAAKGKPRRGPWY